MRSSERLTNAELGAKSLSHEDAKVCLLSGFDRQNPKVAKAVCLRSVCSLPATLLDSEWA